MAFIVEDGSIVAGANAYIDVAFYKSYWNDRGGHGNHSDEQKQAAIVIATQYVDNNFNWRGRIISEEQPLDFPRSGVYDDENRAIDNDVVPVNLKYAICEYAKRQLDNPLQPDVSPDDLGTIKRKREKVDVIEQEIEYQENTGGYYGLKRYPMADNYLKGLVVGGIGASLGSMRRC